MGTRHRAALGVSEVTDALALIVSEENGGISMAENGILLRHVSRADIEKRLLQFYNNDEGSSSSTNLAKKIINYIKR